jgi:acetyl/propionyl-CoA carboxylase alpha subunit
MQYRFQSGDQIYELALERAPSGAHERAREGESYQVTLDGRSYPVEVLDAQPGQLSLRFAGRPLVIYWAANGGQKWLSLDGCAYRLEKPIPRAARPDGEPGGEQAVRAPMPAQVRAVQVEEGDLVEKGQTLLLLEAMKMEIRVKAPQAGKVTRLLVSAGQTVEKEQVLAEVAADHGAVQKVRLDSP